MPSACTPIRLISLPNSQRASYSRKPVAFTIGPDSYAYVLGSNSGLGVGNIGGLARRECARAHSPSAPGREARIMCRNAAKMLPVRQATVTSTADVNVPPAPAVPGLHVNPLPARG